MNFTKSEALHKEALEHIVGGVNSPSRSFKAVGGGSPVAMERGKGAYFWDVDGNKYIDYLAKIRSHYYRTCSPTCNKGN
ncbi:hypothetical protein ACUIAK_21895 [Bacillus cytotoxicus]